MAVLAQTLPTSLLPCAPSGRSSGAPSSSTFLPSSSPRTCRALSFSLPQELPSSFGASRRSRRLNRTGLLVCRASGGALTPELKDALDKFIGSHKVVLFMKGNRNFPQCGFSNTCIQILNQCEVPYETVNILEDDSLRQGVKEYSKWPTYPQLYIDGEFYGGCDITLEAFKSGELKETLEKALVS